MILLILLVLGVFACCRNRGSTELFGALSFFFLTVLVSRGYTIRRGCCYAMWSTPASVKRTLLACSFEPPLLTFHPCSSAIPVLILQCFSVLLNWLCRPGPTHFKPSAARGSVFFLRSAQTSSPSCAEPSRRCDSLLVLAPITAMIRSRKISTGRRKTPRPRVLHSEVWCRSV